ncbi:MAG: hypothetical protein JJT89_09095 [Nitriliruptoraceae bacterium]|nr:hypothetical protein [Nitriliruptoraceae bacterium]
MPRPPADPPEPSGSGDERDARLPLGVGVGLALGVAIGVITDNLALWLAIGVAMGAGIGAAMDGRIGPDADAGRDDEDGAIGRALLWVVAGLLLAAVIFVAVSPELATAAPGASAGIVGLVLAAGIPGAVLLLVAAVRRRRLGLDERDADRTLDGEER